MPEDKEPKTVDIDTSGPGADVELPEDPTAEVEIANRFSGEKTTMPEFAAAVYDTIIGSEMFGDYDTVRTGLDWFKQHFAAQYMVVLD